MEPHTLGAAWFTNTGAGEDKYNDAWEANLISIFSGCRALVNPVGATVAWDVPDDYYYYVTDLWTALLADPYVDYVSVMAYHNSLDELEHGVDGVGGVANVLVALQGTVRARFGIELQNPTVAPNISAISFWTAGLAAAHADFQAVIAAHKGDPSFAGVAFHTAETFWVLPPDGGGDGTVSLCTFRGPVLNVYSNSTSAVSMVVRSTVTGAQVGVYDVSGYVPGPFSIVQPTVGPFRIGLFDAAGGVSASPTSTVGLATCADLLA